MNQSLLSSRVTCRLGFCVAACLAALWFLAPAPRAIADDKNKDEVAVGGEVLFNGKDLAGWVLRNDKVTDCWRVVSSVELDKADPKKLAGSGDGGTPDAIMFRQPVAHGTDIYTEKSFGDC